MAKRPRTRVRVCADDLHSVKDRNEVGTLKFLLKMIRAVVRPGWDEVDRQIALVRANHGELTYTAAVIDWPARKIATRLKLLPEHGYWSDNKLIEILARRYHFLWF